MKFTKISPAGEPFRVWADGEDPDADGRTVHAYEAEDAATEWAQREDWDSAEYDIVSGREAPKVHVRDEAGNVTTWVVVGETLPHYSARQHKA